MEVDSTRSSDTFTSWREAREFVLSPQTELIYLASCPDQSRDVSILLRDTGLRMGEALKLRREDIVLVPAHQAVYRYLIRAGNAKNSKRRNVPLSARVRTLLLGFQPKESGLVLQRANGRSLLKTWLNEQHRAVRKILKLPREFVPIPSGVLSAHGWANQELTYLLS